MGAPRRYRVPLPLFEIGCVVIVVLTLVAMARQRPARDLVADYAALAFASWTGEQSCVSFYRFYEYAPAWHGRVGHVPLLVPLIWPLVILSAQAVARALRPLDSRASRALLVGAVVTFDASLVEVLAVRAGMWRWAEPGHLEVPVIGILGWGYFACGAELSLSLASRWRRLVLVAVAPLLAHAAILASWWCLFRWTMRGDLGLASTAGMVLVGALCLAWVLAERRAGRALPLAVAGPRMIAAALFFALLLTTAPGDFRLWTHTAAVAIPYFAATAVRDAVRRAAAARAPSGLGQR